MKVLGRFIHECITWLKRAEVEEREGMVSEGRYAQGVQNVWFPLSGLRTFDSDTPSIALSLLHVSRQAI
ncbi:hypothetical protein M378DRAFT_172535, partial [Amanita muscaria Koide BX008]